MYTCNTFIKSLKNRIEIDSAIFNEKTRLVIVRFGDVSSKDTMIMDNILLKIEPIIRNIAVIYLVDLNIVNDFTQLYELYDPCSIMFFFRNKHIMVDLGTGNNNKINWTINNKNDLIQIVETVYRGVIKGKILIRCNRSFYKFIRFCYKI
mmetsp:Transcript_14762/g.20690  ORF Transcript_14762/g.20690 Transcript_14762/m.20690 type:complete len:150 (-) Transcript_14762:571-1020(-)